MFILFDSPFGVVTAMTSLLPIVPTTRHYVTPRDAHSMSHIDIVLAVAQWVLNQLEISQKEPLPPVLIQPIANGPNLKNLIIKIKILL